MARWILAPLALLALAFSSARGGRSGEDKGTYLGVLFSPVSESLYAHLPELPPEQGILVTFVLADSPASTAGLQRHDVLLTYNGEKIRDCEHFVKRINDDKPDSIVKFQLIRRGKQLTAEVTLALGPKLKIAQASRDEVPRAAAKPNGPAPVSVTAKPLDGGQMKVTFEYYQDTGRLQTRSCAGSPNEIENEIQKLPLQVQPLARLAFQRICEHHLPQKSPASR